MAINYNYKIDKRKYVIYLQYVQSRWGLGLPEHAAGGLPNSTHSSFTFNISYETIENIHVQLKNFTFHIQIG